MTDTQKLQFLLVKLQETANIEHCYDDEEIYYSPSDSGSYDTTFQEGCDYGEVEYARHLLTQLKEYVTQVKLAHEMSTGF
jgi:hypothetical protein